MMTRLRKVSRYGRKKEHSTLLVWLIQLSLLLLSIEVIRLIFPISIKLCGILAVALGCGMLLFTSIYYLAERQRRDRVLDAFRALSVPNKRTWMYISVLVLVLPLMALFLVLRWAVVYHGGSI